jgi:hypothetical protein
VSLSEKFCVSNALFGASNSQVDSDAHGTLRYPSECFFEDSLNTIEIEPAITKLIFDVPASLQLMEYAILPFLNLGMSRKPSILEVLGFSNGDPESLSENGRSASVICKVDSSLCLLTSRIVFAAANSKDGLGVFRMEIGLGIKEDFDELIVVSLPGYYARVGLLKVEFADDVAFVRNEHSAEVGEIKGLALLRRGARRGFFFSHGEILQIGPEAEGVLGRG